MIEIEPAPGTPPGWKERFFGDEKAGELEPHGMRWHLTVRDEAAWEELAGRLPESLKTKRIPPSLEDVFMELVEGEER